MDYAQRLVYATEGLHGLELRGYMGQEAQREAELEDYRAYLQQQEAQAE
jgi:hypothetical protein